MSSTPPYFLQSGIDTLLAPVYAQVYGHSFAGAYNTS